MRYESKQALMADIRTEHDSLCARLGEIPKVQWQEPGVWGDGWTVSDLVAHLAEWQQMFLGWYQQGLGGAMPEMPARGYKWSQTPKLNRAIWEKHRSRSRAAVMTAFDSGYSRIVHIVEALPPEQLLTPGHFSWTGRHPLTTYLGPNTASHYRFAIKVINRWLKRVPAAHASPAPSRLKRSASDRSKAVVPEPRDHMTKRAPADREPQLTHYANVDLDVYAKVPLDRFVRALGDEALVLYVGGERRKYEAHLELATAMSADDTIVGLIRLIRGLPRVHRQTWNSAQRREFNIGIEAGLEPHGFELRLQQRTLKAITDVRGVLVFTVYAPDLRGARLPLTPRRKSARPIGVKGS